MDVVGRTNRKYDRHTVPAMTGPDKPLYDRVQDASHALGTVLMNLSRAQWLMTNAAYNLRLAKQSGTASTVVEAEFAARDAIQQASNLTSHVRSALVSMDLPL